MEEDLYSIESMITHANQENISILLEDRKQFQIKNKNKVQRAKHVLESMAVKSGANIGLRIISLNSFKKVASNSTPFFKSRVKRTRPTLFDNELNNNSINKRNYIFNKKIDKI